MNSGNDKSDDVNRPKRVVSLLGASTETIYRLGLESVLVGRSHECDYPPQCLSLPCVSRARLNVDACSKDIDEAVRFHSANGDAVYQLDSEVIAKLSPDLIIAQDHCRVCAITPSDMERSESCLNIPQVIVRPSNLQDCLDDVAIVADGLGYPERGRLLKESLEQRLDRVKQVVKTANTLEKKAAPPRVALLEWCDPLMGCGYWLPELVQLAGGDPLHCPPPGGATPTITFQALLESKPDVVIFALCGFGLTRAAKELMQSLGDDKISQLQEAVPNQRVFIVDGNYLVNRSGPRVVESAEALAEVIHPSLTGHFGHYGTDKVISLVDAIAMVRAGIETGSDKASPTPFVQEPKDQDDGACDLLPNNTPDEEVKRQLEHLRNQDFTSAYALNSAANQSRWCSPGRFAFVLKSHDDFRRLLSETADIGEVQTDEKRGIATVQVMLPGNGSSGDTTELQLLWTLVVERQRGDSETVASWRTEKVGFIN